MLYLRNAAASPGLAAEAQVVRRPDRGSDHLKIARCVLGFGFIAACAAGGRTVPTVAAIKGELRDTTPPRLTPDKHFAPPYYRPFRTVLVQGNVDLRLAVSASGTVDTSSVRVLGATQKAFATDLAGSFANLHLIPARSGGRPVAAALTVRLEFRLVPCDTTGDARNTTWGADSTPPKITIWQCYRPIMAGLFPNAKKLAHATLSGLLSISPDWESPTGFQPCPSDHVPNSLPKTSLRGIATDLRGVADWARVDTISGGRHPRDRYFIRWEGDIFGPPASEHLGGDRYQFRPTRILDAARWTEQSCGP